MQTRHRREAAPFSCRIFALLAFMLPASFAVAQGPIPAPIQKGTVRVDLQPVASGLVSPVDARSAPGDTSRLFITDQAGRVRIVQNGALQSTPFMDLTSRLAPLSANFDERGFLGFAFHPDFNVTGSPGFGKVYTYTNEPAGSGTPDFTVPMPAGANFNNQGVVAEWRVSAANPNAIDLSTRREVMRWDDPQGNHNGGPFHFGPDRNLYIAIGDGGGANDNGNGHNPTIGNSQDMGRIFGKMLRIDVNGTNSANGRYGVPANNPFVGQAGVLPEIYASGLRNPFRFSFDRANGNLYVGDVGQNNIEELDLVTAGGNYGWRYKEGTFRFNPDGGTISTDLTALPPGLIDPIMQYDHDEGVSIIGGFVYRGTQMPELTGKYVFGEFSRGFAAPGGRLFYYDLTTGELREFLLGSADLPLGMFVKGMGEDAMGELYLAASTTLGPTGTTGQVFKIVPEPSGVGLVCAGLAMVVLRRRRAAAA